MFPTEIFKKIIYYSDISDSLSLIQVNRTFKVLIIEYHVEYYYHLRNYNIKTFKEIVYEMSFIMYVVRNGLNEQTIEGFIKSLSF